MATPKVIVQLYPVLPAEDRADRERKRPLGRNSELYHRVLHESLDLVKSIDEMGVWGISTIEHHLHSEGYELGPNPGVLNAWWAGQVKRAYLGALGYVMATRDPIRVAEETAILDHMTKGRFFVGLTRGYQARWTNILGQSIDAVATLSDGSADDARNREIFEERTLMLMQCWMQESVAARQPHYEIPYPYETGVRGYPAWKSAETAGAPGEVGPDGSIRRVSVVPSPYTRPSCTSMRDALPDCRMSWVNARTSCAGFMWAETNKNSATSCCVTTTKCMQTFTPRSFPNCRTSRMPTPPCRA